MLTLVVFVCPPLAVLLTAPFSQAVKNVGLTLLLYFPGVWHARAAVERYTVRRRYDALMNALDTRTPQPLAAAPAGPPANAPARLPAGAAPKAKRRQPAGFRAA
jgi:uncharacterized membrane protein YqaE (UPF0057 family)